MQSLSFFILAVTAAILILFFIVYKLIDKVFPERHGFRGCNMRDPKAQLDAISKIDFHRTALMNKGEYRVFSILEAMIAREKRGHRVMVQVNLGEIIRSDPSAPEIIREDAFAAINSKRVDMVVINGFGDAMLAVEVQGSGHYLGKTAFMRDAVKREALRCAGVGFLEIAPSADRAEMEAQIRAQLGEARPARATRGRAHAYAAMTARA